MEGPVGSIFFVRGKAVSDEIADGEGIGDYKALEAPFVAQNIMQQPAVAGGRNVVQVHISAHQTADSGVHGSMKGREIDVAQKFFRNVRRIIIASALRCAVPRKVFGTGKNRSRTELVALKSADLGPRHGRAEVGIFACALDYASPAGIAGDVEH